MKTYIALNAIPQSGGMYRVLSGLRKYLPTKGIEIVDSANKADVVHAHIQLYEQYAPSIPLVVSSHGMLWNNVWGQQWNTNKYLIDAYLQADIVTAPSQFVADAIAFNTLIKPLVVYHGIDPDEWLPASHDGYVLWNKARVDSANDPNDMQKLAELATGTMFRSTFGQTAHNVNIIGQINPDVMRNVVSKAAVYLDTPLESGGPCFGVLEAMSCGVPVLAWDNGGNSEAVVHGETGYLARPGDYEDLLAGLNFCVVNRDRLGTNARQLVIDKYRWDIVIDGYIKAYEQAIHVHQLPVKVSIIVPCYNLGNFLPSCVDFIKNQTYNNWECIIVDDASTDNSLEIAQQVTKGDNRFKVYHNSNNLHVSDTRNRAISLAHGEYILPIDADDRPPKDALENLVKVLDNDRSVQIVAGRLLVVDESDLEHGYYGGWPNNTDFELQRTGYNRLPYSSMYRRSVWERIGGYRRRIRTGVEDADFWTRALSYGCRAEIIEPYTLYYTQRASSLRSANPYGAVTWLQWFPWSRDPDKIPFGATGTGPYQVLPLDPQLSVIIPVGPGHAHHIQSCIDSLIAQSFMHWEAIVVNDTGERWFDDNGNPLTQYVMGMPFVRFIDDIQHKGAAGARNLGVQNVYTERIVFLDVDDTAQVLMLETLLQAHNLVDGWIYGDWYMANGSEITNSVAPDWEDSLITNKSLAPLTGIYWKKHIEEVGGFSTDAPGWEDWDFQLKLVERGICGTRLKYPLIAYHMHLGARREDNFSNKDDLLNYITEHHPAFYRRNEKVACTRCGGGASLRVTTGSNGAASAPAEEQKVKILYTGPEMQFRLINSPTHRGAQYAISNIEPFYVYESDVPWILSIKDYQLAPPDVQMPAATHVSTPATVLSELPLASDAPRRIIKEETWEEIELLPEVVTILKRMFTTPNEVRKVTDAALLSIRGIGESRLKMIRTALSHV